jgi:hypothetical protein
MNVHYYLCILIIHYGLPFFYIMYKLYVPLVMLLSREVLPDFSLISVSISFLMLFEFVGRVFGNTHCVGAMECYMQNSQKSWLSNCLPLSTVSSDGTPNRQAMFCQKNFCVVFAVIVEIALPSVHLVKYSTATKVNFRFPCAIGSGPTMSSPHR